MRTDFFLLNLSFSHAKDISIEDIENAINVLSDDYDYIKANQDKVLKNEEIYDINIYPDYKIEDLYYKNKPCPFSRDTKKFLLKIIDHSANTNWSNEEAIDLINQQESENLCQSKENYGLLALFKVSDIIDTRYIVYNKQNWLSFHRYFLSKYPCETSYFIDECTKCFPNLYFHERNKGTVGRILNNCAGKIIYHLSALNDIFLTCKDVPYSRIETLRKFNSESNFDRDASIEGDIKRKKDLTFGFINAQGYDEKIYCELHLKLIYDDLGAYSQDRRIYFHEGKSSIYNGKILISHIGEHL